MIFPLTNEEKNRLQSLARQKEVVFALKKVFLNTAMKGEIPNDVQILAAERIALDIIQDTFHQLENLKPENGYSNNSENVI